VKPTATTIAQSTALKECHSGLEDNGPEIFQEVNEKLMLGSQLPKSGCATILTSINPNFSDPEA
jgi:hypothetical protein